MSRIVLIASLSLLFASSAIQAKDISVLQTGYNNALQKMEKTEQIYKTDAQAVAETEKVIERKKKQLAEEQKKVELSRNNYLEAKARLEQAQAVLDKAWEK